MSVLGALSDCSRILSARAPASTTLAANNTTVATKTQLRPHDRQHASGRQRIREAKSPTQGGATPSLCPSIRESGCNAPTSITAFALSSAPATSSQLSAFVDAGRPSAQCAEDAPHAKLPIAAAAWTRRSASSSVARIPAILSRRQSSSRIYVSNSMGPGSQLPRLKRSPALFHGAEIAVEDLLRPVADDRVLH